VTAVIRCKLRLQGLHFLPDGRAQPAYRYETPVLGPLMDQKAKYSLRADVFRSAPNNGHRSIRPACPFGAKNESRQPYRNVDATPERPLRISHKKGRGPLDQPKRGHCTDRVRRDHVEPINGPLNQGRFEAKRHNGAEQAARR